MPPAKTITRRPTVPHRYEQLASFIAGLVASGALTPGARVPTQRQITWQRRISLSAALQACRLLEDRGVIGARPRSGYNVARSAAMSRDARHNPSRLARR